MSEPAAPNDVDAQLGSPPADLERDRLERDERQTQRQAPDTAEPGEAAD
ncbi:MAG: hypothetical protein JSR98_05565 [Proteobacteria bacterium]|nr:hypothetical protein [Pseudomonadota bacterium]